MTAIGPSTRRRLAAGAHRERARGSCEAGRAALAAAARRLRPRGPCAPPGVGLRAVAALAWALQPMGGCGGPDAASRPDGSAADAPELDAARDGGAIGADAGELPPLHALACADLGPRLGAAPFSLSIRFDATAVPHIAGSQLVVGEGAARRAYPLAGHDQACRAGLPGALDPSRPEHAPPSYAHDYPGLGAIPDGCAFALPLPRRVEGTCRCEKRGAVLACEDGTTPVAWAEGDRILVEGTEVLLAGTHYYAWLSPAYRRDPAHPAAEQQSKQWLLHLTDPTVGADRGSTVPGLLPLVEGDLATLEHLRMNHVTIMAAGPFSDAQLPILCGNLQRFLRMAAARRLLVTLQLPFAAPWHYTEAPPSPTIGRSWRAYRGNEARLRNVLVTCNLAQQPALIGYILDPEPAVEMQRLELSDGSPIEETARARFQAPLRDAWAAWVRARFGGAAAFGALVGHGAGVAPSDAELCPAEADDGHGGSYSPTVAYVANYRAFLNAFLSRRFHEAARAIRAIDDRRILYFESGAAGNALVASVGPHGLPCVQIDYNPRALAKDMDAISLEAYHLKPHVVDAEDTYPSDNRKSMDGMRRGYFTLSYFDAGRPRLLGEFGWDFQCTDFPGAMTMEECAPAHDLALENRNRNQRRYYMEMIDITLRSGLAGFSSWWLIGETETGLTGAADFGIVAPDFAVGASERWAAAYLRTAAPFASAPAPCPETLMVDEDELANPTTFHRRHREAYYAAHAGDRCAPRVATPCSGVTTAAPLWHCQGCTAALAAAGHPLCEGLDVACELKCFKSEIEAIGPDSVTVANTGEGIWKATGPGAVRVYVDGTLAGPALPRDVGPLERVTVRTGPLAAGARVRLGIARPGGAARLFGDEAARE